MNSFGNIYRLTSFGESHGAAVGGVIDGIPAGVVISLNKIQEALDRRRPGTGPNVTPRREPDRLHILSGLLPAEPDKAEILHEGSLAIDRQTDRVITLGTPIGFYIENTDARPGAYDQVRELYRPNHADITYDGKYGLRDHRGGGRSSGRETISRVVAGAIAEQFLSQKGISVSAKIVAIGGEVDSRNFASILADARERGDSVGGVVECRIQGVPAGLGEPTFGKLQQMLASAMMSIGGAHGFEYGDGFGLSAMRGSDAADIPLPHGGYESNHCGGILGGISSGQEIVMRVGFKPTPSLGIPLRTIDRSGNAAQLTTAGRHDPCIAVRGVEVVRAMASIVLLDAWLMNLSAKNF